MRDFLKELCSELNIQLVYELSQYTDVALSSKIIKDTPTIKASHIFFECPEKTAKAIIGYCTGSGDSTNYLKQIEAYLDDNIISIEYSIEPPDEEFKQLKLNSHKQNIYDKTSGTQIVEQQTVIEANKSGKRKTTKRKEPSVPKENPAMQLVEMDIQSIVQKSFLGKPSDIGTDNTIRPSSEDVLELDIIIDHNDL